MLLKKLKKKPLLIHHSVIPHFNMLHYIKEHSLHVVDIGMGRPQDN